MSATFITFYSFKGGVGRTQALANVAVGLANRDRNVVVVDMDLESPGLHMFFYPEDQSYGPFTSDDLVTRPGFIDFVEECFKLPREEPKLLELLIPCTHPHHRRGSGSIRLLPAGRLSDDYPKRIGSFPWEQFYEEREGYRFMELFHDRLLDSGADYVLVDSRTGMTDVANICTFQLPDVVVVLFALHEQGIDGALRMTQALKRAQEEEGREARPRRVILLPSRVEETGELGLRNEWLKRARERLQNCGEVLADHEQRIPYLPQIAYGEQIVVDPEEPNILSEAYHRLIERLLGSSPRLASPTPLRLHAFSEIRQDVRDVEFSVRSLVMDVEEMVPVNMAISEVQRRAQQLLRQRDDLLRATRRVIEKARVLASRVGEEPDEVIDLEARRLDTIDDWRALASDLSQCVEEEFRRLSGAKKRKVEARLVEAADHDGALLKQPMADLEPLLSNGEFEAIDDRLPAIEEELARSGLDALLRRDALDRARLARSRPDLLAQNEWLDDRLQKTLTEGGLGPDFRPMLRNLLRLRLETLETPTQLHWSAYEALCGSLRDEPDEVARTFTEIGQWLWGPTWKMVLSGMEVTESLRGHAGPLARKSMELALKSDPDVLADWVEHIGQGLVGLWREGKRKQAYAIVSRWREDAGLRAALKQLHQIKAPARARRELLSLWIREGDVAIPDTEMWGQLTKALVEEGFDAEAFYALEAFRSLGVPGSFEDSVCGQVSLAFLLRAIEHHRGELALALLADKEIRDHVVVLRAGKALFVLLAWQPWRFPERVQEMRVTILQSLEHAAALPPSLPPHLMELAEDPIRYDIGRVGHIEQLRHSIQEEYQANRFRANWIASRHYEADFHNLVSDRLRALLEAEDTREAEIKRQESNWNADEWIAHSYTTQREKGLRTNEPDGNARRNIIEAFQDVRRRFLDLAKLRPPEGSPSLARMIEQKDRVEGATRELREWLLVGRDENVFEQSLSERVIKLTVLAREEEA